MPKAIPNRVITQLRLDETAHNKARIIARKEDRTLNSQFEYFIKKGIEYYERDYGVLSFDADDDDY